MYGFTQRSFIYLSVYVSVLLCRRPFYNSFEIIKKFGELNTRIAIRVRIAQLSNFEAGFGVKLLIKKCIEVPL